MAINTGQKRNFTFYPNFSEYIALYRGVVRIWMGRGTTQPEFANDEKYKNQIFKEGYIYAEYRDGQIQEIGPASSFAEAVERGYAGPGTQYETEEDWIQHIVETTLNAKQAEAWATGSISGVPITEGMTDPPNDPDGISFPQYRNSAKYYAGSAESWAEGTREGEADADRADSSTSNAKYHREQSEAFANGTIFGHAVESGESGYKNNALWHSKQSQAWATGSIDGTDVQQGDIDHPQFQNNAKWFTGEAEAWSSGTKSGNPVQDSRKTNNSRYWAEERSKKWAVGIDNSSDPSDTNNAKYYSETAEAWAEGTRHGQPDSTKVKHNAKYYQEQAEAWATGTTDTTASQHDNNSKFYAGSAESWAAGTREGVTDSKRTGADKNNAQYHAGSAESWAKGTRGGNADTERAGASTDNAMYWAEERAKKWAVNSSNSGTPGDGNNAQDYAVLAQKWAYGTDNQSYDPTKTAKAQADRAAMLANGNSDAVGGSEDNAAYYRDQSKKWAVGISAEGSPSDSNNAEYYARIAKGWAGSDDALPSEENSAKKYRDLAKDWAVKSTEVEAGLDSAKTYAKRSSDSANDAKDWATKETEVESGLNSSKTYAERAAGSSKAAEQWATGETGGTPSSSNNAKEYARQSEEAKKESEKWATGGTGGSASASNNSKYFSQIAAQWATGGASGTPSSTNNAKYYSTQSASQADESEAWAVGTKNGIAVQSGEVQYQNSARYYAQEIVGPKYDDAIAKLNKFENLSVDVTSLDPGSVPTAVIDKDGAGYILHLGIPKGDSGNIYALIPKVDQSTGLVTFEWTTDYTVINSETMLYESTGTTTIHDKVEALEQTNEPIPEADIDALFH